LIPKAQWTAEMNKEVACLERTYQKIAPQRFTLSDPGVLYHYTSTRGLKKILSRRTIRVYDIFSLKDTEEFKYPLDTIKRSIQACQSGMPDEISTFFQSDGLKEPFSVLTASFCQASESAFMWRRYARRFSGACIRIKADRFARSPESHAVYPMVYDLSKFKRTLDAFLGFVAGQNWNRFDDDERKALSIEGCMILLRFLFNLKRERFRKEREWRALILERDAPQTRDQSGRPFLEIPLRREYVSGITLGSRSRMREGDVIALLRGRYPRASVSRSYPSHEPHYPNCGRFGKVEE